MEKARIVSDNACFGFDRAFCLTDFTSCQYEIATCNEEKFDTGPPDLDKFVQIQQKPKIWVLYKNMFFSKKLGFFTGPTIFWVFEAPGIYIGTSYIVHYTYRIYIYIYSIYIYIL